jgi:RNA polymerase sigma-70 factor (ECF subfamily)
LLHDVVQGFTAPTAKTREQNVTASSTTRKGFEELFLAHYVRIAAILRRMLGDSARAEDLANEVFLKLYGQPFPRNDGDNLPGWLYRTAMNLGIDALRSSARRSRYEQAAAREEIKKQAAENGFDQALRAERQQRVRAVLAELKPAQGQLLLLRASGHSYKELADCLGVEPGSVGTLLIRAEAAFEQRYLELYGREEGL